MTGWGQSGMYADAAGHDINYISLAGALAHFGRRGPATSSAPQHGRRLRRWRDVAGLRCGVRVVGGATQRHGAGRRRGNGRRSGRVDEHVLVVQEASVCSTRSDAAPTSSTPARQFYDVYQCADGKYISIGSIEPQFYAEMLRLTGSTDDPDFAKQMDKSAWPHLKQRLAEVFAAKTRDEWCSLMEATDVCFAPVLDDERGGPASPQRASVARSSRSPARPNLRRRRGSHERLREIAMPPAHPGQHTMEILRDWGFDAARIDALIAGSRGRRRVIRHTGSGSKGT